MVDQAVPVRGTNSLNDPEERKKFKDSLATLTHYFRQQDDARDGLKESVADLSAEYGLDKKTIRKMARTMYMSNYADVVAENNHFSELYETLIEGKLQD
jgi:hypothetical protein